jgi:hypothetical protein
MKNLYKRTKLIIILIFSLLVVGLTSCDKAKQLDGTTWEGGTKIDLTNLKVSIEFEYGEATIYGKASGYLNRTFKGVATYSCKKNDITLDIRWLDNWVNSYDEGIWKGTIKGKTMILRNVYGETVEFTRL